MNVAFDPSVHDYSDRYEETQQFSGRFRDFARDLAQRWIDRYDLHGRHCFEIGCGKGSFLEELCVLGGNRGTGIDPSFRADRVEANANVQFVADFYDERYGTIDADAVICRHTLEHIPDVQDFMRTVRAGIGDERFHRIRTHEQGDPPPQPAGGDHPRDPVVRHAGGQQ